MNGNLNEAARSFAALTADSCRWCSSPFHEIYRKGLCRHCYEIALEKRRLCKQVQGKWRRDAGMPWKALDLELRVDCYVAGMMEEIARAEGQLLQFNREPAHSAMTIENLLDYISNRLLRKNCISPRSSA